MAKTIKYINSAGRSIDLSAMPVRIRQKAAGFNDYEWEPVESQMQIGSRVSGFRKYAYKRDMTIDFTGAPEERAAAMQRFYELTEYDVRQLNAGADAIGRLYVGEKYVECYIVASETIYYPDKHRTIGKQCVLYVPHPFWMQEATTNFRVRETIDSQDLDFSHDFPHDFAPHVPDYYILKNPGFVPCSYKLVIYGQAVNPTITIAGVERAVYAAVPAGNRLEIDSRKKTVTLIGATGQATNLFNARKKDGTSIFEDIPAGDVDVSWDGSFPFDLTLNQERSELEW